MTLLRTRFAAFALLALVVAAALAETGPCDDDEGAVDGCVLCPCCPSSVAPVTQAVVAWVVRVTQVLPEPPEVLVGTEAPVPATPPPIFEVS